MEAFKGTVRLYTMTVIAVRIIVINPEKTYIEHIYRVFTFKNIFANIVICFNSIQVNDRRGHSNEVDTKE